VFFFIQPKVFLWWHFFQPQIFLQLFLYSFNIFIHAIRKYLGTKKTTRIESNSPDLPSFPSNRVEHGVLCNREKYICLVWKLIKILTSNIKVEINGVVFPILLSTKNHLEDFRFRKINSFLIAVNRWNKNIMIF